MTTDTHDGKLAVRLPPSYGSRNEIAVIAALLDQSYEALKATAITCRDDTAVYTLSAELPPDFAHALYQG